jgi:hypothetical protein
MDAGELTARARTRKVPCAMERGELGGCCSATPFEPTRKGAMGALLMRAREKGRRGWHHGC